MTTKRKMDNLGIKYEVVDLTTNLDVLEQFKGLGHTQAPIVTTDTKIWSGFRNDKIESLARHLLVSKIRGETE
jgi:glutaredoxin-like protein NrdH